MKPVSVVGFAAQALLPRSGKSDALTADAPPSRMVHTGAVMHWLRTSVDRVRPGIASEGKMPSFDGATTWLNSRPLKRADLRGNVVAVQFWTYSCIEWLGTFAHLIEWSDRYQAAGLSVIGVHTPEHSFEHDLENVRRAIDGLGITYPIAIDNHYAISNAFKNGYTPTLYVVDAKLRIRRRFVGQAGYDEAEQLIRQLLVEAHPKGWVLPLPKDDAPPRSVLQSN